MKLLNAQTLRFLGITFVIYIAFLILGYQAGFGKTFANTLSEIGEWCYSDYGDTGKILFSPNKPQDLIIELRLINKAEYLKGGDVESSRLQLFTWLFGYIPITLLISLILASPISLRRKITSLVIGILIFTLFLLLKMNIYIWEYANQVEELGIELVSDSSKNIIISLRNLFLAAGFNLAIVVFIWLGVSFNRTDWIKFQKEIM